MKPAIRACLAILLLLVGIGPRIARDLTPGAALAGEAVPDDRIVVLISMDGVSAELLDRARTPWLDALARRGVLARRLSPPFPPNTFPVHATLATGVFPDKHGIVNNKFFDRKRGRFDREREASWLRAEPIWATAERQGVKTGVLMWVASAGDWRGTLPSASMRFNRDTGDGEKVERILEWLSRPPAARPRLILAWFEGSDEAAHRHGPNSREAIERLEETDRALARFEQGLLQRGLVERTTLVVVSDHGLIPLRRVVNLARILEAAGIPGRVASAGAVSNVYLDAPWERDRAQGVLASGKGYRLYRREALPPAWHAQAEGRVGDFVAVAEPGVYFSEDPDGRSEPAARDRKGGHGYPPGTPGMDGILIAAGPGLRSGARIDGARAVDIYPTICILLGIRPAAGIDGRPLRSILPPAPLPRTGPS